eukprot:1950469-Amphidinium_carterae.1
MCGPWKAIEASRLAVPAEQACGMTPGPKVGHYVYYHSPLQHNATQQPFYQIHASKRLLENTCPIAVDRILGMALLPHQLAKYSPNKNYYGTCWDCNILTMRVKGMLWFVRSLLRPKVVHAYALELHAEKRVSDALHAETLQASVRRAHLTCIQKSPLFPALAIPR